jgi:hypothetical protein
MPWCETCSRFYNPTSLHADGSCPTCGTQVAAPVKTPWHFKLLLASVALYLGWRAWQGIEWVLGR